MTILKQCKSYTKKFIVSSRSLNLINHITPSRIAILKYHSVQDKPELFDDSIGYSIIHPTSSFARQMELIAKYFDPITMDDVLLFLKGGKKIPKRAVVVTFDDGYVDNFDIAAPILNKYGIKATFYVTVSLVGSSGLLWFIRIRHALWTTQKKQWAAPPNGRLMKLQSRNDRIASMRLASKHCASLVGDALEEAVRSIENELDIPTSTTSAKRACRLMGWDQIKELHCAGHIIGSHTLSHLNMAHIRADDLHKELTGSKRLLEKEIGSPVIHFSYPNPALVPHFSKQTTSAVKQAGYETAVISTPAGPVNPYSDPFVLKRMWTPVRKDDYLWNLNWTLLGRSM